MNEIKCGEKVRPYWERYFQVFQGIIFVVNSAASEEELALAKSELYKALRHTQLRSLPLLVLANFSDAQGARSSQEVSELLELEKELGDTRHWQLHACSIHNKDGLREIFQQFNKTLLDNLETEIEKRKNSSPQHTNRL
nr:hypothetical protein BaRGS_035196 [Batillaria attramentaria]